jgi:hypothetical protein
VEQQPSTNSDDQRTRSSTNQAKIRRKVLVALATLNGNESLDQYLMIGEKQISGIVTGLKLQAVFARHLRAN